MINEAREVLCQGRFPASLIYVNICAHCEPFARCPVDFYAVRSLLGDAGMEVCGEAVDGSDAILKVQELKPDAVVMDVSMPNLNGIEATTEIVAFREMRVVIMSQHDFPDIGACRCQRLRDGATQRRWRKNSQQSMLTGPTIPTASHPLQMSHVIRDLC